MGWDDVIENKDFTKIEAGKDVRVHILPVEPPRRKTHFKEGKSFECKGDGCDLCHEGLAKKDRWTYTVFSFVTNKEEKLEVGVMIYKQVKETWLAYDKDLSKVDLIIKRSGSGPTDTRYSVIAVPTKYMPPAVPEVCPF